MELSPQIVRILLQLGAFLQKDGNRITEEFGLNQQQFVLLNEIVEKKSVNQKHLVGELLLEKSNVSKIVKKLHLAELITVSKSPYDRRATILMPTQKGKDVWATCMNKLNKWNRSCLQDLNKDEAENTLAVLKNLKHLMIASNRSTTKN